MWYGVAVSTLLAVVSMPLLAQRSDWEIRTSEGSIIRNASLIGLEGDSLLVSSPRFQGKLHVGSIERLRSGRNHAVEGAIGGFVLGGLVGYFLGSKTDENENGYRSQNTESSDHSWRDALMGGAAGGALCGIVGALTDKNAYRLSQKSNNERFATLQLVLEGEGRPMRLGHLSQQSIVRLKNDDTIRGRVVELIPDSTIRILTLDSNTVLLAMSDVARLVAEEEGSEPESVPPYAAELEGGNSTKEAAPSVSYSISAGGALPTGKFGETTGSSGGSAKVGVAFGGEIAFELGSGFEWLTSLNVSLHSIDPAGLGLPFAVDQSLGSWTLVWPMTGLRLRTITPEGTSLFASCQFGLLVGSSPEILVTYQGFSARQSSASATSGAVGVGFGVISAGGVTIFGRYLYGSPEYEVLAFAGSTSLSGKVEQPTSVVMFGIGYSFR